MSNAPQPKPQLENMHLYSPGQMKMGARKLSSNENLYGPSPLVKTEIAKTVDELWRYPDASYQALRQKIATTHKINLDNIICGVGSDEILQLLAKAFIREGDEVIIPQYGFEVYDLVTQSEAGRIIRAKEVDFYVNIDEIIRLISNKTRVIFFANPANPTSTFIELNEVERLITNIPPHILVVLDGAYAEFVDGYDGGLALSHQYDNLFVTRTFSKLYGLGGVRIGWGYGAKSIIDALNKIRGPFNLSSLATKAAEAALASQEYYTQIQKQILTDKIRLENAFAKYQYQILNSHANFLTINFGQKATDFWQFAHDKGYILRKLSHYKMDQYLRITIGTTKDVDDIITLLEKFEEI